jgi:LacI family transcriptional regulator
MKKTTSLDNKANKRNLPSIAMVATAVGVSKSTVSHAFTGNRRISEPIKRRIFEVAKSLKYKPNFAAQALSSRKTMNVGIMVREATDQYFSLHIQAMEAAAVARGYRLLVGLTGNDQKKVQTYLDGFISGQADGVLVITGHVTDEMVLELVDQHYPVVVPQRSIPGYDELSCVQMDIEGVFRQLLDYLYDLGHRQFGFIGGGTKEIGERYRQLHRFVEEKGLEFGITREVLDIETLEAAEAAGYTLLKRYPQITALVCSNDVLGVGAMTAALGLGLKVPTDLTVTGFDDVPISRYCIPRLTTVRIPISDLASISMNNLLDRIEGKTSPALVRLPLELLIRGSSAPPKVRHEDML